MLGAESRGGPVLLFVRACDRAGRRIPGNGDSTKSGLYGAGAVGLQRCDSPQRNLLPAGPGLDDRSDIPNTGGSGNSAFVLVLD